MAGGRPYGGRLNLWSGSEICYTLLYSAIQTTSLPAVCLSRTSLLGKDADPMLWFTLMLMPTGPPAIKLVALADVNGSSEEEKMVVAKFLTVGGLAYRFVLWCTSTCC